MYFWLRIITKKEDDSNNPPDDLCLGTHSNEVLEVYLSTVRQFCDGGRVATC